MKVNNETNVKMFKTLHDAKTYLKMEKLKGSGKMVFGFEMESLNKKYSGWRTFFVEEWKTMFLKIKASKSRDRRYYEIITDSCKAYVDAEFYVAFNPELDGYTLTLDLVEYLITHLKKLSPVTNSDVMILESHTTNKFSIHLIFNLRNHYFKDNEVLGSFMRRVAGQKDFKRFLVKTETGVTSFVDLSVYGKSQNFRMIGCTKLGKESFLKVSPIDQFVRSKTYISETGIFYNSLITNFFKGKKRMLRLEDVNSVFASSRMVSNAIGSTEHKRGKSFKEQKIIVYDDISDFDVINTYVKSKIGEGTIRNIVLSLTTGNLIYNLNNYRYCQNISRAHRSNKVFLVVDSLLESLYQCCHDKATCGGYRSDLVQLPKDVSNALGDLVSEQLALHAVDF
jgi:DNA-directed primase/polymerase protein